MSSWEEDNSWRIDSLIEKLDQYYEDVDNNIWVTREGLRIPIHDMETRHIENCLNMIYRSNGRWRREYLPALQQELLKRKQEEKSKLTK